MDELGAVLAEVIEMCIEREMVRPFILISASRNGSVLALRCNEDGEPDVLAEHYEDELFLAPVNVMVVDQNDEAVHITIEAGKAVYH